MTLQAIPNERGASQKRMRIPSFADVERILSEPEPMALFYQVLFDRWEALTVTRIDPPLPFTRENWDGRDSEYAAVWYRDSFGSTGFEHRCDIRIGAES